jgi:hypothetical protein
VRTEHTHAHGTNERTKHEGGKKERREREKKRTRGRCARNAASRYRETNGDCRVAHRRVAQLQGERERDETLHCCCCCCCCWLSAAPRFQRATERWRWRRHAVLRNLGLRPFILCIRPLMMMMTMMTMMTSPLPAKTLSPCPKIVVVSSRLLLLLVLVVGSSHFCSR